MDAILLSTSGDGNDGNWSVIEGNAQGLGWSSSQISNDADSGISSDYAYTSAINLHGTNNTINGVLFTERVIVQETDGHSLLASAIMLALVRPQFPDRWELCLMRDLSMQVILKNKIYWSGGWAGLCFRSLQPSMGGDRTCSLSCSDISETFTVNQDQYDGQSPDGLLVECHYIAQGTEVEFTIDPIAAGTWHLYAFSNGRQSSTVPLHPLLLIISGHCRNGNMLRYRWKKVDIPVSTRTAN